MREAQGMKSFDITIADPVQRIQGFIDSYLHDSSYQGFEAILMRNTQVISAERARSADEQGWLSKAVFEVRAVPGLCNPMNNMHGGAVALLADMMTSMAAAPAATKGFWEFGGVSRTLNVTYLRPVLRDSIVEVECKLVNVSARLSVIQCVMRDKTSRKVLALAEHGKAALSTQKRSISQSETKL